MFAIMRLKKHSSWKDVRQSASHHLRAHSVSNADTSKTHQNRFWGAGTPEELLRAMQDRVEPLVKRKDNVRAIEVFLGASPEWFKDRKNGTKELTRAAAEWLATTFGKDNVTAFGLHLDETTPHIWAMVAPIKDGKLNAKAIVGDKKRMTALQDSWAKQCQPIGLQRGIRKSGAKHTSIRTYYAAVNGNETAAKILANEAKKRLDKIQKLTQQALTERAQILAGNEALQAMARKLKTGGAVRYAPPEKREIQARAANGFPNVVPRKKVRPT